jgi:hypothetical protein
MVYWSVRFSLLFQYSSQKRLMFFFIAGIQPKTVALDGLPKRCPSCGLDQALTKRVDHYLSLFFLPSSAKAVAASLMNWGRCGMGIGKGGPAGTVPIAVNRWILNSNSALSAGNLSNSYTRYSFTPSLLTSGRIFSKVRD